MKVLMATMKLDIGGAETHIVELSKALKRRGIDVYVASAGGAYEKELTDAGIKHFYVPMSDKNPKDVITAYKTLKNIIIDYKIDVVHGHARIPCFILNLIRKSINFRFVTTAHWVFSLKFPYKYITKWGDRSLAVSDDIKKYLIDNYGIKPGNIRVTINGIDTQKFSKNTDYTEVAEEFGLTPEKRRIVYVSRMDIDRSLAAHKLISIAEKLDEKIDNLEILIVGGGNDFENMKTAADNVNNKLNKPLIKYTGSRTDINKLVASGEIFIGVSRAALEAMAAEKPSIIAGNEGYIGIFDQDKLGISIDTNFCCRGCRETDENILYEDIIKLMGLPEAEKTRLGSYSKEVIEKYYSIDTMADDAMKMYVSIIKSEGINDVTNDEFEDIDEYIFPLRKNKTYDVMISGYYGFDNSGDDSILKAIVNNLKELKPDIKILALSNNPKQTKAVYGVDSIHRFNFPKIYLKLKNTSLLISGGGSLIQDITSDKSLAYYLTIIRLAQKCGTKVMLYSNGIGPIQNKHNYAKIKNTLDKVELITLREDSSKKELEKIGVNNSNIIITADPAFTLKPTTDETTDNILLKMGLKEDSEFVCISVRPWKTIGNSFEKTIAATADYIKEKYGIDSVFVPMQCPKDVDISKRISSLATKTGYIAPENLKPPEILGLTARSKIVIGMRLHTLIYAAATCTPIIGLIYDPKINAIMDYIDQKYSISVDNLNPVTITRYIDELILSHDDIVADLKNTTALAKEKALDTAKLAVDLIKNED